MKIEHTTVAGWEAAIRGMRNPLESWERSDSRAGGFGAPFCLGAADLDLARRLVRAGASHRKFLRMIGVWVDITAARYWWTDFDTYKIGTVKNSCSTMHKLGTRDLTPDDFVERDVLPAALEKLNGIGREMRAGKRSAELVRKAKRHLPEGFLIKATWHANYEVLLNAYRDRENHRLEEFPALCRWIESLPYMAEFIAAAARGEG